MSAQPNLMPLLLTISQAAGEDFNSPGERVLHAAVHAWAEGHVASPGHKLVGDTSEHPMPSPPFPYPHDNCKLKEIIETTSKSFGDGKDAAAITLVAALGWSAGYDEGLECSGCALEGADSAPARAMRAGHMGITFRELGAPKDIFELAESMGITPETALRNLKRIREQEPGS